MLHLTYEYKDIFIKIIKAIILFLSTFTFNLFFVQYQTHLSAFVILSSSTLGLYYWQAELQSTPIYHY